MKKWLNSLAILLLGIVLGIFSKWLDHISIDNTIWWQHILGILDLGNVFSEFGVWLFLATAISVFSKSPLRAGINVFLFFAGMTGSYHLYTILFCGFNPKSYMMIWYGMTVISPVLAFVTWHAKRNSGISYLISSGILAVMMLCSFGIGIWYFDFKRIIDTLLFIGTAVVLYDNPKKSIYSLVGALVLVFLFRAFM